MDSMIIVLHAVTICLLLGALYLLIKAKNDPAILNKINALDDHNRERLNEKFNTFTDRMDRRINDLVERNAKFETDINRSLYHFQDRLNKALTQDFQKLQETLEGRLNLIDQKVTSNLAEGFEKTNQTFIDIVQRLSKIDEAQKKIDSLSVEIVSLQDVLTDKKTRGAFGEVQLNQILSSIFGDGNDTIYQTQYSFNTGARADAVLFAPQPLGTIAIDSKFPLENYRKMIDRNLNEGERTLAQRQFAADCRRHVDTIANRYIIDGVTSDQALMFVPAEAVFAQINAYHQDIIDYAQRKRVWIVSPTTLMSTLTTIQTILVNIERSKYASVIQEQLRLLHIEFDRYRERWNKLSSHMDTVTKDIKDIHTTTEKITRKFESISSVEQAKLDQDDR